MKLWKKGLACLLAAAFTLAVLTGCSGLLNLATVQTDAAAAAELMAQIDGSLQYSSRLEDQAERLADWLTEQPMQMGTSAGQFVRRVQLDANSGNMTAATVNEFLDDSGAWLFLDADTVIGLTMDNQSSAFTGYLYAPSLNDAAALLNTDAAGCTQMGAVFIEYSGETYVVALFR